MSLNDEERQIIVNLEKEKALNTFAEMEVLRQQGFGIISLIDFITLLFTPLVRCLLMTITMSARIKVLWSCCTNIM